MFAWGTRSQRFGPDGFGDCSDVVLKIGGIDAVNTLYVIADIGYHVIGCFGLGHVSAGVSILVQGQREHPVAAHVLRWHLLILLGISHRAAPANLNGPPKRSTQRRFRPNYTHYGKPDTSLFHLIWADSR